MKKRAKMVVVYHVWFTPEGSEDVDLFFATEREAFKFMKDRHAVTADMLRPVGKTKMFRAKGHPENVHYCAINVPPTPAGIADLLTSILN